MQSSGALFEIPFGGKTISANFDRVARGGREEDRDAGVRGGALTRAR